MDFKGRVIVITGGAKGIGAAAGQAFVDAGASVALLDVDADAGNTAADALGEAAMFLSCDVSREAAVQEAVRSVLDRFGRIDVLVNNAGIQRYSTVTETSEAEWDHVLGVNLKSAFLCAKHTIPSMLQNGAGVVVNVSSVQAFLSQNNVAPYTTSKSAMLGLTRSIAVDYAPHVRCVAVCPGTVDTPMLQGAVLESADPDEVLQECIEMHPLRRLGTSEEVANLIVYLASDQAAFITGQAFRIDGGLGLSLGGSKR